ncbi:UNVERIFIED_CONTAM: urease accessory protein UreF [Spiribacter pallidus]
MVTITLREGSMPSTDAAAITELRLWQLISPALPVGAYAYSAGLEAAIERGWVRDTASLEHWLAGQLEDGLAGLDLPVLERLHNAWLESDEAALESWTMFLLASRETAELRAEDIHIGRALARLLNDLGVADAAALDRARSVTFATALGLAGAHYGISERSLLQAYAWAWCENQVAAAVKLIPLGQSDGQRVLMQIADRLPATVGAATTLDDAAIGATTPGVALASSWHETQYTRLFRS